jgi:hypothetical protein
VRRKIRAKFVIEQGTWSNDASKFINKMETIQRRDIEMEIVDGVLKFHGGPTGYESFLIKDLLCSNPERRERFCICAGTINRWAKCTVPWKDVYEFITQEENEDDD